MKWEYIDINQVVPNSNNPRYIKDEAFKKLVNSIKEFPVIVVKWLSEKAQREFIIKDNVGYGEWDWEMLANEWDVDELGEWGLEVWKDGESDSP